MDFIDRNIYGLIKGSPKSVLLLGPRQAGKSTLMKKLSLDLSINLSDESEYLTHLANPEEIKNLILLTKAKTIYIDEIQRLPSLLNTIQVLIDNDKTLHFFLTGSSARKLKRGNANLLPGRIFDFKLGPLVCSELNYEMDNKKALELGTLPEVYLSNNKSNSIKLLKSYAGTYLREEIKAESLVRNLESFSRFLQETILTVGEFVDYTKLAKKTKISRHAIPRYFEILEDTMIAQRIFAYPLEDSDDLVKHPKFFLFDNGVYNTMLENLSASSDRIGRLAEQLIFSQLQHSAWSKDANITIYTYRTRAGSEVDFIVKLNGELHAIEVKTSDQINSEDCLALSDFQGRVPECKSLLILHMGYKEKSFGNIQAMPWQNGLKTIGL